MKARSGCCCLSPFHRLWLSQCQLFCCRKSNNLLSRSPVGAHVTTCSDGWKIYMYSEKRNASCVVESFCRQKTLSLVAARSCIGWPTFARGSDDSCFLFDEPELKHLFNFLYLMFSFPLLLFFQDDGRLLEEAFFMYRMVKFGTAGRASVLLNGTRFMLDAISHRLWEVVQKHVIVKIVYIALSGGTLESCPVIEQVDLITEEFFGVSGWWVIWEFSSQFNLRICMKPSTLCQSEFRRWYGGNISEGVPGDGAGLDIVWRRSPGPFYRWASST